MVSHVKILGTLHIILGAFGVLCGLGVLLFFGGLAGLVSLTDVTDGRLVAVPILGALAGIGFLIALILSVPGILAGIGLLQFRPWGRILAIVLSAIHLLNVPVGTAIGLYGLWVLFSRDGQRLFESPPSQPVRV